MAEIIELKPTAKQRWKDFKAKAKAKVQKGWEACKENKELVVPILAAMVGGAADVITASIRAADHKADREMEDRRIQFMYGSQRWDAPGTNANADERPQQDPVDQEKK